MKNRKVSQQSAMQWLLSAERICRCHKTSVFPLNNKIICCLYFLPYCALVVNFDALRLMGKPSLGGNVCPHEAQQAHKDKNITICSNTTVHALIKQQMLKLRQSMSDFYLCQNNLLLQLKKQREWAEFSQLLHILWNKWKDLFSFYRLDPVLMCNSLNRLSLRGFNPSKEAVNQFFLSPDDVPDF